jgi:TolA-binding protein
VSKLPSALPDEPAVERVWRRVVSRDPQGTRGGDRSVSPLPRWWIPAAVALAVLALVAFLPSWWNTPGSSVKLALSSGGVFSSRGGGDWKARVSGDALAQAERVRTDPTGHALLRVDGIAAVLLATDSDAAIEELGHGTFLRLSRGTLTARVSRRGPGDPFVVRTARYTITVVGTLFTVEEGPGRHTAVSVREGVVEISDTEGHVYRVVAGTRWTSEDTEARSPDRTPDAVKSLLESGLQGRAAAEMSGALAQVLSASAAPVPLPQGDPSSPGMHAAASPAAVAPVVTATTATADPAPLPEAVAPKALSTSSLPARTATPAGAAPAVAFASAPPHDPAPAPAPAAPPVATTQAVPEPLAAQATATEPSPAVAAQVAPEPPASPAADDGAYAKGLALEARGDYEGAAQALSRAASTDAHRGDLALYSLGRLAQRRLHDPRRALEAFRRYRVQYPQGALLPEVDFAILQIEVEGDHPAEALTESTRFLLTHPTSERAQKVHLLRANLLRDAGRCAEALADYQAIHGPDADDAVYSSAYCQRKLGDRAGAARTLRDYLARFPAGAHRADAARALESENETEKKY